MKLHQGIFSVLSKKAKYLYISTIFIQILLIVSIQFFNLVSSDTFGSVNYTNLMNILEPYLDYKIWYQRSAFQFVYTDWVPYLNYFDDPSSFDNLASFLWYYFVGGGNIPFIYPPFFLYVLTLPAFININLVFLPLLIANIMLPIVIFKFLSSNFNHKIAEWGFLAMCLCPLLIFYNGGLLLNTSLMTLFFTLSLYYISIKRFNLSIVFFAIAILFKQTVVLFGLPLLTYIVFKSIKNKEQEQFFNYFKNLFKFLGILIGILFIGSLPWIIINPISYINSLYIEHGISLNPDFNALHYSIPVHWYDFLSEFNTPYWIIYILGFLTFSLTGIIIVEIFSIVLLYYWQKKGALEWLRFFDLIIYVSFLTHLFFPRGVYKYYFTFHIPLIVIWLCSHFHEDLLRNELKQKRWLLYFIIISLGIMFIPRNYYLMLIWLLFSMMLSKNRSLYKSKEPIEISQFKEN